MAFVDQPDAPRAFRDALGLYASGLTIVTGIDAADEPVGFTCQSFFSVSLEPPLVSLSVMRTSTSYPRLRSRKSFGIDVLAHDQAELATQFARSGADKWAGVTWSSSQFGNPRISGSLLHLDCFLAAEHEAGDHLIVIGEVLDLETADDPGEPLVFYQGRFQRLGPEAAIA